MQPTQHRVTVRDVDLVYFEWGRPARGKSTVLLVHATGFHARCWDATARELGPDYHVVALDMRGHGRSDKRGPYEWGNFGADVTAFVDFLALDDIVGVGHSMGGHSVTQAAAYRPERFRGLVLVDPVIMAPEAYASWATDRTYSEPAAHPVARRRNQWTSANEMFERFVSRHPFNLWREDILRDYCEHGILPAATGGFELACPPIVEAAIYMGSAGRDIGKLISTIKLPVVVMRAFRQEGQRREMDFAQSPTWPALASSFENGRDVYLPDLSHFIPMQRPDLVADEVRHMVGG